MSRFLNPGNSAFRKVIGAKVYVDKTGLIGHLNAWINTDARFVCVSRARRFGKTVTAKMIEAYYDNSCDSRELFAPFEIAKDSTFDTHLNRYEVISLDVLTFLQVGQDPKTIV